MCGQVVVLVQAVPITDRHKDRQKAEMRPKGDKKLGDKGGALGMSHHAKGHGASKGAEVSKTPADTSASVATIPFGHVAITPTGPAGATAAAPVASTPADSYARPAPNASQLDVPARDDRGMDRAVGALSAASVSKRPLAQTSSVKLVWSPPQIQPAALRLQPTELDFKDVAVDRIKTLAHAPCTCTLSQHACTRTCLLAGPCWRERRAAVPDV